MISRDRFVALALIGQSIAEIAMRVGEIGFQADCAPIGGYSLVKPPKAFERIAKIAVDRRVAALTRSGLGDQRRSDVVTAEMRSEHAEIMIGVGMIGIE